jgi:pilus assembly protein TadC
VEDAQTLIKQELSLFQSEIKEDLGRAKTAAIPLFFGMAVSLLAGFFLFMAAARLLMYEWPNLPDYAAYGIVGAVLAVVGTALLILGNNLAHAIEALPKKTVQTLKENVQWKTQT